MFASRYLAAALVLLPLALSACAAADLEGRARLTAMDVAYPEKEGAGLTAEQHLRLGEDLLARGRLEGAYVHYAKALSMAPEDNRARLGKAEVLLRKGLPEQAMAELNRILEKEPENGPAHQQAAYAYFRTGLFREAQSHSEAALAADPGLWRARTLLGVLADRAGQHAGAEAHYRKALESAPGRSEILADLGVSLFLQNRNEEAVELLTQAARAGASDGRLFNNLGFALAMLGRNDEALSAFRSAGTEAAAWNNLGLALMRRGEAGQAVACFEKALEASPAYYVKAYENLKQARLAVQFRDAGAGPALHPAPKAGPAPRPDAVRSAPAVAPEKNAVQPPRRISRVVRERELPQEDADSGAVRESAQSVSIRPETGKTEAASAEAVPAASAPQTGAFAVHVSSWRSEEEAMRHVRSIRAKGYEASVAVVDLPDKGRWHRVMVGTYPDRAAAAGAEEAIRQSLGATWSRAVGPGANVSPNVKLSVGPASSI